MYLMQVRNRQWKIITLTSHIASRDGRVVKTWACDREVRGSTPADCKRYHVTVGLAY